MKMKLNPVFIAVFGTFCALTLVSCDKTEPTVDLPDNMLPESDWNQSEINSGTQSNKAQDGNAEHDSTEYDTTEYDTTENDTTENDTTLGNENPQSTSTSYDTPLSEELSISEDLPDNILPDISVGQENVADKTQQEDVTHDSAFSDTLEEKTPDTSKETVTSKDLALVSLADIDGKITEMWSGSQGEVLLLAKHLHIYDVTTNSITATSNKDLPEFRDVAVHKISTGYALLGNIFSSGGGAGMSTTSQSGYVCYLYDETLEVSRIISIPNFYSGTSNITISPDGTNIFYFSFTKGSIEKLNIGSGQTTTLINFDSSVIGNIASIQSLTISEDGSKLIFIGQSMTATESVPCYGAISMDGNIITNKQYSGYQVSDEGVLGGNIFLLLEDSRSYTGRLLVLNVNSYKETMLKLTSTKEANGRTVISENGKYFATGELKSKEYLIRVYQTSDGALLNTTSIYDDNLEYFFRGSSIVICEETRSCTVSLGNWHTEIDTKLYSFGF